MLDLLTSDGMMPFLFCAGLVIGLLLLEMIFMLIGISTELGGETPGGIEPGSSPEMDIEFASDFDPEIGTGVPEAEAGPHKPAAASSQGDIFDILGMRGMPLTVWLAFFAASFAALGLSFQAILHAISGMMLHPWAAAALLLYPAIRMTRGLARFTARLLPRETTSAISERSYGRRIGKVTVGTARRGAPAQVGFTDGHGNLHYTMAEPMDDAEAIPEGTDVLIMRTRNGDFRLVRVS